MSSPCEGEAQGSYGSPADLDQIANEQRDVIMNQHDEISMLRNEVIRNAGMVVVNNISNVSLENQNARLREDNAKLARENRELRQKLASGVRETLEQVLAKTRGVNHQAIRNQLADDLGPELGYD